MQGQQYPPSGPTGPYASNLLNDIHNYFPNLLYLPGRFNSVRDVMQYIQQQMSARYDTFSSWRSYYERMDNLERIVQQAQQPQPQQPQQQQQRRNHQQTHWNQPRHQPRPRVYVPPSPEVQVTAEVDQTALNTILNQAFLGGQTQTNDTFTNTLLRYILNPLDMTNTNPNTNRTTPFWEPVLVIPTAAQIAAASTTYTAPTVLDTPCAICQDSIAEGAQVRKLSFCNHFFHKECVDNWFLRDTRCPTCRHDVRIRGNSGTTPAS